MEGYVVAKVIVILVAIVWFWIRKVDATFELSWTNKEVDRGKKAAEYAFRNKSTQILQVEGFDKSDPQTL